MSAVCPACGYDGLDDEPWAGSSPSDEICPSCGIQFGYDDASGGDAAGRAPLYAAWRERWKAHGCRWWSRAQPPPPGWSPSDQLARVLHD